MKTLLIKMALKRELRKARRSRDLERADLIVQALEDGDLLEYVSLAAEAEYNYGKSPLADDSVKGDTRDFLEWFKDFMPQLMELIAFIMQMLALFGATEEPEEEG